MLNTERKKEEREECLFVADRSIIDPDSNIKKKSKHKWVNAYIHEEAKTA